MARYSRGGASGRTAAPRTVDSSASRNEGAPIGDARPISPRAWLLLSAVCLAVIPWGYWYAARQAIDRDPFIYAQTAKEVLAGKRLYDETWMDKPPLGILVYAIPQIIVPRSYPAIALFGGMVIVAQALAFAYAFRDCRMAVAGCILFGALYPLSDSTWLWPSTEHFSNVFVAGNLLVALAICRQGRYSIVQCLAVGAFTCAAFHVRQNTLLSGGVPAIALLLAAQPLRYKLRGLAAMLAGAVACWGAMLLLMAAIGDLRGYFWTTFYYPRLYAQGGSYGEGIKLVMFLWTGPVPFLAAVFAGLAANPRYRWLVVASIAIAIVSTASPMRYYPHYWANSLPYLTLLVGLGIEQARLRDVRLAWVLNGAIVTLLVLPLGLRMHFNFVNPTMFSLYRVAETLDRVAPPDATVLVLGPLRSEAIQFASRLPAANKYEWMFHLQAPWIDVLPDRFDTILAQYVENPPDVIVIQDEYLRAIRQSQLPPDAPPYLVLVRELFARNAYEPLATQDGYVIARRSETSTAPRE